MIQEENSTLFDTIITDEKVICPALEKNRELPVYDFAFGSSPDYVCRIGVTIASILENNPDLHLRFNIFIREISKNDLEKLTILSDAGGCQIILYFVDDMPFTPMLHEDKQASIFYRFLFAPILAKKGSSRIFSIDGDVLCSGSISSLLSVDFNGKIAAAVRDTSEEYADYRRSLVGTKQYFNSGMSMIDTAAWNDNKISEKCWDLAIERRKSGKHLRSHDQDILNILLNNDILLLPPKYNYIYNLDIKSFFQKQSPIHFDKSAVFIHYAGVVKPWRTWIQDLYGVKLYRNAWLASPWKDVPLTGFTRHKDIHQAARHARRMHNYKEMLSLYMKYLFTKLVVSK